MLTDEPVLLIKRVLRSDEDKTLCDIVRKLNKHSDDVAVTKALAEVYKQAKQRPLERIAIYSSYTEINRWNKINKEPPIRDQPDFNTGRKIIII